jgi:carbon monoxide dehydrogenase subunit G
VRYTRTVEIAQPPEDVFAFLADLANLRRWQPSVLAVDPETVLRGGDTYRETRELLGKRGTSTLLVTACEPGRELSLRVVEGPVPVTVRHVLEPAGAGTRLTLEVEGGPTGLMRLAAPIAERAAGRQASEDLERLKALLEH